MESFSLDSTIDPELHKVMDELLESVYGEEILSDFFLGGLRSIL